MYWFQSISFINLFLWIFSVALFSFGGWLLATHLFHLENEERLLTGFGLGLVCYLWLINLLGHGLPLFIVFFGSAVLVVLAGLLAGYFGQRPFLGFNDLKIGGWLVAGLVLAWMFLRVSKGTGLFDEYKNLALISTMANGWIPPLRYFGYSQLLDYHYGFHLFGASMMFLGRLMPWSAFDLSKAILWSYSLLLIALAGKRFLNSTLAGTCLASVMALATGTRYLLLLLPAGFFNNLDRVISLVGSSQGTAATFTQAMSASWIVEDGPPVAYPFAFLNGINPPYVIAHGGESTIQLMLLALVLLILGRAARPAGILIYAVFFSFCGLASESFYGVLALGGFLFVIGQIRKGISFKEWDEQFRFAAIGAFLSLPLVFLQGGTITSILQAKLVVSVPTSTTQAMTSGLLGFSFQWPPAIVSAHLGNLSLLSPMQAIVGLFELGPIIFFLPWLTIRILRNEPSRPWLEKILLFSSWAGLLLPIFLTWRIGRDIIHITSVGLELATLLLALEIGSISLQTNYRPIVYYLGILSLMLSCVGGVVLAGVQLTAAPYTMYSNGYGDTDARLVQQAWGRLPRGSKVFGRIGKASVITGQFTGGIVNYPPGDERAIWQTLENAPTLDLLTANHFDFILVDTNWWNNLPLSSQQELSQRCITTFAQAVDDSNGRFSRILDLRGCYPANKP